MIIQQTREAIKFYELAIKNAQNALEFQVNQDKAYIAFQKKYEKIGITTLFYGHTQSFGFYNYREDTKEDYFTINGAEITFGNDITKLENVEDIAHELFCIVKRFYEE